MISRTKTSEAEIKRIPLRLAMILGTAENTRLVIATPEATGYHLETALPLGLPIDIVTFIHLHCRCAHCGKSISRDLKRCDCGKPSDKRLHLEVDFPNIIYKSIFRPIIQREQSRIASLTRKQRIEANGGTVSKDEIAELYSIQEGFCYFCGDPISNNSKGSYHIDHYQSIYDGGRNDLSNIVLTCPSCNRKKGIMHGDTFERIAKITRPPDTGRMFGQIRKKINIFRAKKDCTNDNNHNN